MLKMSEELKELYNEVYEEGKETFHTFSLDLIYSEVYKVIKTHLSNRKILDLGCGDGDFLKRFVTLENISEMYGYDFSEVGIDRCKVIDETTPDRIFDYMEKYNLECERIITFDHSRGLYDRMVEDLSKRIKLALVDKVENVDEKVKSFLDYLQFITHEKVFIPSPANGAECIWIFKRKETNE